MAVYTWGNSAGGNFGSGIAWLPAGTHPIAGDTAGLTNAFSGAAYNVDVTDAEAASVVNISAANAELIVENSGGLFTVGAINLTAGTLAVIGGGEITGHTTITDGAGGTTIFQDGTLDGVTWKGTLALTGVAQASSLVVTSSLNVLNAAGNGPGEIDITGAGAEMDVGGSMTLNGTNGNLLINIGTSSSQGQYLTVGSADILTLGSAVSLNQIAAGSTIHLTDTPGVSGGKIVNNGTMSFTSGTGSGAVVTLSSFVNNGTIILTGGGGPTFAGEDLELTPNGTFADGPNGLISVSGYGLVHINGPNGSVDVSGTIQVSGHGTVDLDTASAAVTDTSGTGVVRISSGGVAEINYDYKGTVAFLDATGTLALGHQGGAYTGTVAGMSRVNATTLDVIDLLLTTNVTTVIPVFTTPLGGVLEVMDNTSTLAAINLAGNYIGAAFTFGPDGQSTPGTNIFLGCFAEGTRILTENGEVAVEALAVATRVLAHTGDGPMVPHPVVWIGRRTIDCRRQAEPAHVWPIRVRAGAFGPGAPRRDLWLSPDHAVYVRGVLIPIRHLINGTSIEQTPVDLVTYHHVALPRHAVLLAEGLAAESYLDTGDRFDFVNGGPVTRLFPAFAAEPANISAVWEAKGCAPLVVTGPELRAVRRDLARRVAAGGAKPVPARIFA